MDKSTKLAKFRHELYKIKAQIDNELIPISGHLEIDDPELITALEELSKKAGSHFENSSLVSETVKES